MPLRVECECCFSEIDWLEFVAVCGMNALLRVIEVLENRNLEMWILYETVVLY